MYHLFPSSSVFGGFFVRILSGFGFLPGAVLLELVLSLRVGTGAVERSVGFLCVCIDGSTFFKPDVTPEPLFRSAKTAPISDPLAGALLESPLYGGGGGPGGGGGGAPPAEAAGGAPPEPFPEFGSRRACSASTPCGFHCKPFEWCSLTYDTRDVIVL